MANSCTGTFIFLRGASAVSIPSVSSIGVVAYEKNKLVPIKRVTILTAKSPALISPSLYISIYQKPLIISPFQMRFSPFVQKMFNAAVNITIITSGLSPFNTVLKGTLLKRTNNIVIATSNAKAYTLFAINVATKKTMTKKSLDLGSSLCIGEFVS